ncbi:hypothetical protein [Streptomyces atratus]|uniref:hypothetical protein n=1 Tax=Streptomyces atratus TaxID=1893 RepID=UPI0013005C77|nr:hypothetical protein [Streptomyces atratus]
MGRGPLAGSLGETVSGIQQGRSLHCPREEGEVRCGPGAGPAAGGPCRGGGFLGGVVEDGGGAGHRPATTLGAGLAPLIATSLLSAAGGGTHTGSVSLFLAGIRVVSAVAISLTQESHRDDLPPRSRPPRRSGQPLRPDRARAVLRGSSQAAGARSLQHRQGPRHV